MNQLERQDPEGGKRHITYREAEEDGAQVSRASARPGQGDDSLKGLKETRRGWDSVYNKNFIET